MRDAGGDQSGNPQLLGADQRRLRLLEPAKHVVERRAEAADLVVGCGGPAARIAGGDVAREASELVERRGDPTRDGLADQHHHQQARERGDEDGARHRARGGHLLRSRRDNGHDRLRLRRHTAVGDVAGAGAADGVPQDRRLGSKRLERGGFVGHRRSARRIRRLQRARQHAAVRGEGDHVGAGNRFHADEDRRVQREVALGHQRRGVENLRFDPGAERS